MTLERARNHANETNMTLSDAHKPRRPPARTHAYTTLAVEELYVYHLRVVMPRVRSKRDEDVTRRALIVSCDVELANNNNNELPKEHDASEESERDGRVTSWALD